MTYRKISFPAEVFKRFMRVAALLGYSIRGHRWRLLDLLLSYAETHPDLFRSRALGRKSADTLPRP